MASYIKYNQFMEDVYKGVHNFTSDATSSITVALSNTAGDIASTKATLSEITQISTYANLSSRIVTGVTAEQTNGTVSLTATDLVLTASGTVPTFQYVILYNDDPTSPADPLICAFDYGSPVSMLTSETFTIDFPTNLFTSV
jgi:hypothetical protein